MSDNLLNLLKFIGFCVITSVLLWLLTVQVIELQVLERQRGMNEGFVLGLQGCKIMPSGDLRTKYLAKQTNLSDQ